MDNDELGEGQAGGASSNNLRRGVRDAVLNFAVGGDAAAFGYSLEGASLAVGEGEGGSKDLDEQG